MRTLKHSLIASALLAASTTIATSASAAVVAGDQFHVITLPGSDCPIGGAGGFANCYATASGTTTNPNAPNASQVVAQYAANGTLTNNSGIYPSFTGSEVSFSVNGSDVLSFLYTASAGDPLLKYIGLKQGASYALFYNSAGFTSGDTYTFNLDSYFTGSGISHLTVFNATTAVPEPGTWAMMLLGFGAIGASMRQRRARQIPQFA